MSNNIEFWIRAEILCDALVDKSLSYAVLSDEEVLMYNRLCSLLGSYYRLQQLIIDKDIKRYEKKELDNDTEENNGTSDSSV